MTKQIKQAHSKKRDELFADSVTVDIFSKGNTLFIPYTVILPGKTLKNAIEVSYEFELDLSEQQIHLLKMGVAIFLAQTFLSKSIDFHDIIDKRLQTHYNTLLILLYNLRNYKEDTNILPPIIAQEKVLETTMPRNQEAHSLGYLKKAVNLISGGKDSLAAAILLEQNGFETVNCFISGFNLAAGDAELTACKKIFGIFYLIDVKGFEKIINEMSKINKPNEQPSSHTYTIIYARDLLSILFALPVAIRNKANYLSFGAERDVWKSNINGKNGPIPLQDTQSELIVTELNKIIKFVIPEIHLFSPIAGLTEISILSWLLKNKPRIVSVMSSCSHGTWCGRCWKCTRYYLIQKYVGVDIIPFQKNPLRPKSVFLQSFFMNNPTLGTPYDNEISFLLKKLRIQESEPSSNHLVIPDGANVNINQSNDLFRTHSARLIPLGFQRKLLDLEK